MNRSSSFKFRLILLVFIQALSTFFIAVKASDYYFRPTNVAMVQSWTRELSFTVSNPSNKPVVLKITSRQVGIMPANAANGSPMLTGFPASVLLMPGEIQRIDINYENGGLYFDKSTFELVVEQLPILFVTAGTQQSPKLMNVTRYIADIEVRENTEETPQYAFNNIGASRELKQGTLSSRHTSR